MKLFRFKLPIIAALISAFFVFSFNASADTVGQNQTFIVSTKYDQFGRTALDATLRSTSSHAYFYVDDRYWNSLNLNDRSSLTDNISTLGQEFDRNIYPTETQFWGSEPNPGIDRDPKITVLLEYLISGNGGYFNTANVFSKKVAPDSNERKMVFINVEAINGNFAKIFLGHEFQHLISTNQKELKNQIQEDVWLNELRSEYTASVLGYNNPFNGSNLNRRLDTFSQAPSDSLTEWPNVSTDYGQVALFAEYLAEQYGQSILSETLQSPYVGIESINQYLQKHGYAARFSNIYENWTIANYLNDNSVDRRYGYQRQELKNIHISPAQQTFVLYPSGFSSSYNLKPWQGQWYQYNFSGLPSDKAVKIDFNSDSTFRIAYVDNLGRAGVLNNPGYITNPGGLRSVVLMPINESKTTGFSSEETPRAISFGINYVDNASAQPIADGALIKRPGESEMYVVEGKYKRYLRPEIIKLYGQLDPSKVTELDDKAFNSYNTANYVRYVGDKKVYAVWPDGTKHWLNMTGDYFTQSGRDWNAIFVVNESEFNSYKKGADIKQ